MAAMAEAAAPKAGYETDMASRENVYLLTYSFNQDYRKGRCFEIRRLLISMLTRLAPSVVMMCQHVGGI